MIREHPRFQKNRDDIHLGDPGQRHRPSARLRDGRGRLRSGAGWYPKCCAPRSRYSPSSIARPVSWSGSMSNSKTGFRAPAPRNWNNPTPSYWKAKQRRRSGDLRGKKWDRGTGIGSMATSCGTKAQYQIGRASIPPAFELTPAHIQSVLHPDDVSRLAQGVGQLRQRRENRTRAEFRIIRPDGENTLVRRHGRCEHRQRRPRHPRQRRHR